MDAEKLVGRDAELEQLDAALADAGERGLALLISGAAGIGKTSLLDHVAVRARNLGGRVLTVRGIESEADLPYAGLHQLLQPVLGSAGALPVPQRDALLTALGTRAGARPQVYLVGLATLNLVDEIAGEKPLVLLTDDAQWLDAPTSAVLTFVSRRLESTHILLVICLREGSDTPFQSADLPDIHVGPLNEVASSDLLASSAPDLDHHTRRLILDEALGNPLALVELPRALRIHGAHSPRDGPRRLALTDRLERSFSAQSRRLPKPTQSVLLLLALDEDPTLGELLEAAQALAVDGPPAGAVQPALEAGLISVEGSTIRFRHPLIRSAIVQASTASQRRSAHLALAKVITDPDRRAWHRARAAIGEDDDAAQDLEAAAQRAYARGAPMTAVAALELSASLTSPSPEKAHRLMSAADLSFELGDERTVRRLLDAAARLELSRADAARMNFLREIFRDAGAGGPTQIEKLVSAAGEAADIGDRLLALTLIQSAAQRYFLTDPDPAAKRLILDSVGNVAGDDDLDPLALRILAETAPTDMGSRVSDGVRRAVLEGQSDPAQLQNLAAAAYAVGDIGQSIELRDRIAHIFRAEGRLGALTSLLVVRAWGEINVGQFASANQDADEGHRLAVETGQPIWVAMSQTARGILLAFRGETETGRRLIVDAGKPLAGMGMRILDAQRDYALGVAAITEGLSSEAFDHFARMLDADGPSYHELTSTGAAPYVVECGVRAGRGDEARRVLETLEALAARTPAPLVHIGVRFGRAVLAEDADAERLYQEALNTEPRWPFPQARLQLAFGSWLRRQRRITESRPYLRAARFAFEALGVPPWADKARAELRASGERTVAPTVRTPLQPLSPQELQIAQMAASGLSNREIGNRLFLSHRTVGAHLYRVFPKLGITSRSALAQVLSKLEPSLSS